MIISITFNYGDGSETRNLSSDKDSKVMFTLPSN